MRGSCWAFPAEFIETPPSYDRLVAYKSDEDRGARVAAGAGAESTEHVRARPLIDTDVRL